MGDSHQTIEIRVNPETMKKIENLTNSLRAFNEASQSVEILLRSVVASLRDLESALSKPSQGFFEVIDTPLGGADVVSSQGEGEPSA